MAFLCGFVAFYTKKKNGIPHFYCLPLGTFTWSVKFSETNTTNELLEYDVRCACGNVSEKDIHVVNFLQPVLNNVDPSNWSPMVHILKLSQLRSHQMEAALAAEEWNQKKHIAVTEKVDLKDPTTSGLQLLDDLKRYNLTGKHNNMNRQNLLNLRTQNNASIETTTEGTFQWVHSVFSGNAGQTTAAVHVMPPNMDIKEIGNLEVSAMYEYFQNLFEKCVLSYFDIPAPYEPKHSGSQTQKASQMDTTQYKNVIHMSRFCEKVIRYAYCVGFGAELTDVEVKVQSSSRMELKSIDDLKVLGEVGILNPQDKMRIRKLLFNM